MVKTTGQNRGKSGKSKYLQFKIYKYECIKLKTRAFNRAALHPWVSII
jgi:hypothetical protein